MLSRREWLFRSAAGFGGVALATLLADQARSEGVLAKPHHPPKAKAVIFLYMDGGPSQVDTFDYKPTLEKFHGKDPHKVLAKVEPTQFANVGKVMQSPWKFQRYGECGAWVSDLFPHVAKCVDDLAFVKSLTSKFSEHTSANYFLHTGAGIQGRPSWGAWASYGLGSGNRDLPTFVILNGGLIPPGGLDNFNSGFLPAAHQGSVLKAGKNPLAYVLPLEKEPGRQKAKLDLMRKLDRLGAPKDDAIDSAIANYETAFRMQTVVPEIADLSKESEETKKLYGLDSKYPHTVNFGTQCLIARRLVEKGVRFVELTCPSLGHDRWDQHSGLKKGHEDNARAVDQPIAGLLTDLKKLGMLDSTLVVWGGEFGRTPFAQGSDGRDHNPFGFTVWMAGGGAKGGVSYGSTDEFGYKVADGRAEMHDLHATMLHLLGVDHTKLTFRFGGRDMRLTDVHGEVIKPVVA
ncbi:MAG: DUF1501 domain-containing protein [Fimbriiglobus sp.]|jgi:hypothetical protein|nr:DUF1501 domain-containing protein [Fimbriiglobus sp.]